MNYNSGKSFSFSFFALAIQVRGRVFFLISFNKQRSEKVLKIIHRISFRVPLPITIKDKK
jgi:hypothetical protein